MLHSEKHNVALSAVIVNYFATNTCLSNFTESAIQFKRYKNILTTSVTHGIAYPNIDH